MKEIQVNSISPEVLLDLYERNRLLYSNKKEKLLPVLSLIKENLKKAFELGSHLYRTLYMYREDEDRFASISAWRYSNSSMIIQHLVSNDPKWTREIFFYHILKLAELDDNFKVHAILTYYQTKTAFVHRMFKYLQEQQIDDGVFLQPFHYYGYRLRQPARPLAESIVVEAIKPVDFVQFGELLLQERGQLYLRALDLNREHINLETLNERYKQAGLLRTRSVLLAKATDSRDILGAAIINRTSIGLHLSLVDNSTEIVLDGRLDSACAYAVGAQLVRAAEQYYREWPLEFMPLLVKSAQSTAIEGPGYDFQRVYSMMICNRKNFLNWLTYLFREHERSLHYSAPPQRED